MVRLQTEPDGTRGALAADVRRGGSQGVEAPMLRTGKGRGANQFVITIRRNQPVMMRGINNMLYYEQIGGEIAREKVKDMVRAAERSRLLAEVQIDNEVGRVAVIRRQIGAVMVRAGHRIGGAPRPEVVADALPYGGALRTAR